jgi:Helix-turn-helix domain
MPKDDVEEARVIATPDELATMRAGMPNDGIVEYGKVNIDLVLERWKAQCDRENEAFLAQWRTEHPPEVDQSAETPARHRKPVLPVPDGLMTEAEAAGRLRCSLKTVRKHMHGGALRYVSIGLGEKRKRRMIAQSDLNEFIRNQTRTESSQECLSTGTSARRIGSSIFKSELIGFTARRKARLAAKLKR